jgi:hypothetical protein
MLNGPIILFHPLLGGSLSFWSYEDAIATADELGLMFDLNHLGFMKSRATLCHT